MLRIVPPAAPEPPAGRLRLAAHQLAGLLAASFGMTYFNPYQQFDEFAKIGLNFRPPY